MTDRYDVMGIYSLPGTKVRFAFPDNGWPFDKELAAKLLVVDEVYTVERTNVGGSSSDVFLREVPGVRFNTVLFTDYIDPLVEALRELEKDEK